VTRLKTEVFLTARRIVCGARVSQCRPAPTSLLHSRSESCDFTAQSDVAMASGICDAGSDWLAESSLGSFR